MMGEMKVPSEAFIIDRLVRGAWQDPVGGRAYCDCCEKFFPFFMRFQNMRNHPPSCQLRRAVAWAKKALKGK